MESELKLYRPFEYGQIAPTRLLNAQSVMASVREGCPRGMKPKPAQEKNNSVSQIAHIFFSLSNLLCIGKIE